MVPFADMFAAEFENQTRLIGRFNLAIFGKTGTGKSTLVNAIFGAYRAATGIGEPVTKGSQLYLDRRATLGVIDTQGLEIGRDDKVILAEMRKAIEAGRKKELSDQIHAAWYCVRGLDRRFEATEADFIRGLAKLDIPVIVVLTQVPLRDGVPHPDVVVLARHIESLQLPIVGGRPYLTNALRDSFTNQPEHGLMELTEATFRVVPEAIHAALATAQTVSVALKARVANAYIGASVTAAAAAAAVPIPMASAAVLVPIQLAMMARIAHLYAIPFDRAAVLALASSGAATQLGRSTATKLIGLIPWAGRVASSVIDASVAGSFTLAMGQAWLAVCQKAAGGDLPSLAGVLDVDAVRQMFTEELGRRLPRIK